MSSTFSAAARREVRRLPLSPSHIYLAKKGGPSTRMKRNVYVTTLFCIGIVSLISGCQSAPATALPPSVELKTGEHNPAGRWQRGAQPDSWQFPVACTQ